MQGLGDCINQMPVVRAAAERIETYLATPWPQLYRETKVKCIRFGSMYRMQARNEATVDPSLWHTPPEETGGTIKLWYKTTLGNLHHQFEMMLPLAPKQEWIYDIPRFPKPPQAPKRPYAVLRPATLRAEWRADARNPRPEYLVQAASILRDRGIPVVLLGAREKDVEWIVGETPDHDVDLTDGSLMVDDMLGLIQGASICVGGEGFILPAAMASKVPVCIVYGGRFGYHRPTATLPPRLPNAPVETILPDEPCPCHDHQHACNKHIANFAARFATALDRLEAKRAAVVA
jgi:ADP-heptose:LPS heptosyltransferase